MRGLVSLFLSLLFYISLPAQRLVLPGDHPDPSVVKIGNTYWATATTSNWMPVYPLLQSTDLIHWKNTGYVFDQKPQWADYYFWAPEISYENGKVYIYYSAHKKGGNLCVGVASADRPEGPYTDHGPLICQPDGSIDAFPMRDENGKLYLIWKEDGNSINQPTPIWAQQLNEERTALIGEKVELFRNSKPWEGNLVEGVAMIQHGDYFYAIYAAAGCCGVGCTYQTGVARAKNLLGPWEKYSQNPVLTGNEKWMCPGHGTAIEKDSKYYFLYHAYNTKSSVFTGRQGVLKEFQFTPDNWIQFVPESSHIPDSAKVINDSFTDTALSNRWQWSVFKHIDYTIKNGNIIVQALPDASGAYLGQFIYTADYTATTTLLPKKSTAEAGLALIGDDKNMLQIVVSKNNIKVVQLKGDKETIVAQKTISRQKKIYLSLQVKNNKEVTFLYSTNAKQYHIVNTQPLDASYLPPWDRAIRVGIVARGQASEKAVFTDFSLASGSNDKMGKRDTVK